MRQLIRVAILTALMLDVALAAGAELLQNGRLDGPAGKDGVPQGWTLSWKATRSTDKAGTADRRAPDFGLDGKVFHSGLSSVRIGVGRAVDDARLVQHVTVLPAGKTVYRVRAWIKTAGVQHSDARVTVSFGGKGGKWLGADYGLIRVDRDSDWTLHASLFIIPPGTTEIRLTLWSNFSRTGPVTAWFDDVELESTELSRVPPPRYVDTRRMPRLSAVQQRRGYVAFRTNYLDMVFRETVPTADALDAELSAFASPGEYEPMSLAVRALQNLGDVAVRCGPLTGPGGGQIPPAAIDVRAVRFLQKKPHYSKTEWLEAPAVLERRERVAIGAHTSQPFWLTVHTPADARPGVYRGQVEISARGRERLTIPVRFEVLPIRLCAPDGMCLGMYDSEKCYSTAADALYEKYVDMREHGMNSVGFCGGLGGPVRFEGGQAQIAWDDTKGLALAMHAFQRAGLRGPLHWLMSGVTQAALRQGALDSPAFAAAYRSILEAVLAESRRRHWPAIIYQSEDEAFEHRVRWDHMVRTLQVMRTVPGLRTAADGMNGNPEGLDGVLPLLDVLNYHDGPHLVRRVYDGPAWERFVDRLERAGQQVWFYNIDTTGYHPEIMRFGYGFHLIRCRAKGSFCWAYQWGTKDPYVDPLKGFNFMFRFPPMGQEPGGPSTGWEATREGADDLRYYLTYQAAARRARRAGDAARLAIVARTDRALAAALAKIAYDEWTQPGHQGRWTGGETTDADGVKTRAGHYKLPNGWDFAEPDRLRRLLADAIVALAAGEKGESRGR